MYTFFRLIRGCNVYIVNPCVHKKMGVQGCTGTLLLKDLQKNKISLTPQITNHTGPQS